MALAALGTYATTTLLKPSSFRSPNDTIGRAFRTQICMPRTQSGLSLCHKLRCRPSKAASDRVEELAKSQSRSTDLLAVFIKSDNPAQVARTNMAYLDENFFLVSSTYMEMARKEGNDEMFKRIGSVLKIAMEEKGKTLPEEMQLINKLLSEEKGSERMRMMGEKSWQLEKGSRFLELLGRMTTDVETHMDSQSKARLLNKLHAIRNEADQLSMSFNHSAIDI